MSPGAVLWGAIVDRRGAGAWPQVFVITDWRRVLREDPLLPARYLPPDWPAMEAARRFHQLHDRFSPGAARAFAELLER